VLQAVAKKLMRRTGLSVHRMTRFERLLQRELDRGDSFVFVQIGANDGISFDKLFQFNRENKTSGLVVEPLSDMFERLRYNYRSRPSVKPVRAALHPTQSTVKIHRVRPDLTYNLPHWASGIGSLDPKWHDKCGIADDAMIVEEVPAMTLMELLKAHSITRLNLLQIDVEGFDAEVIGMIDFDVIQPSVIKYECVHLAGPDPAQRILHANGYRTERAGDDMIAWRHTFQRRFAQPSRATVPENASPAVPL
jgi:FkbM family methyltransferase